MVSTVNSHGTNALKTLPEVNCYWNKMMGKVVEQAGPYLYPCSIEYSLICAGKTLAVLYLLTFYL